MDAKTLKYPYRYGIDVGTIGGDFTAIVEMRFEEAEALIVAYRLAYPQIAKFHEELAKRITLGERFAIALKRGKGLTTVPTQMPKPDKSVRVSAKSGATWPKPKRGY